MIALITRRRTLTSGYGASSSSAAAATASPFRRRFSSSSVPVQPLPGALPPPLDKRDSALSGFTTATHDSETLSLSTFVAGC